MSKAGALDTPPDAASEVRQPGDSNRHVPGEQGLWLLLFGDLAAFAALFTAYLYSRGHHESLYAQSQTVLNRTYGATNTLVLLTSSILIVIATLALRNPQWSHLAARLTIAGALVGACFVVIKGFEYQEKVAAGITLTTNEFFNYYYVITALHLAHVCIGLMILVLLSRLARLPAPTPIHISYFEGGACYWHMVDLLWILIFPLLYLVR